ncbi:MAG: TetR/AcrR family transcriptional regulator [Treponema sp.]|nr:TetR/AcrR family transcriptional regulator [Treponema sp.]
MLKIRISKDAETRKTEILNAAEELFSEKGYDGASISDIIDKVGVARGTVYYHFKSKEDVLDALIERMGNRFLTAAREIAADKSIPVLERWFKTLMSLSAGSSTDKKLNEHMHKPQNARMHQKTHKVMLKGIPPILTEIVEDGIKENLFNTPYPCEIMEMIVAYVIMVFDDDFMSDLPPEKQMNKIVSFIFNVERLLGAESGAFAPIMELFNEGGDKG